MCRDCRSSNFWRPVTALFTLTMSRFLPCVLAIATACMASQAAAFVLRGTSPVEAPGRLPTDLPHRLRGGLAWQLVQEQQARDGTAAQESFPELWFEQKLNHSDPNSPTFQQLCVCMPCVCACGVCHTRDTQL